ncbi:hypothetical protein SAMN05421803_107172 [Nocardiopsis flavescens]|uniref:Uncharacterized protein n=1 Tax=Nocardiopsis flavescens TaxID=758803 RepID=A0A1M6KH89_9ACTN|nr:hypothetical protein [Nocardiopsis flavescens]SHJ58298.1 hypothetical protein SAMN05421803_107172 [Nocardiopsis flavescens]
MPSADATAPDRDTTEVVWTVAPASDARMGRLLAILFQPRPADEAPEQPATADRS